MAPKKFMPNIRRVAKQKGFRSGLEMTMLKWANIYNLEGEFESDRCKFVYTVPAKSRRYTCDFAIQKLDGSYMYIETKGRWTAEDRQKMFLIRQSNPHIDFRMAFQGNPEKNFIGKKGGTSYADICNGLGRNNGIFQWKTFSIPYCWADIGTKKRVSNMLPDSWMRECVGYTKPNMIIYKKDLL